MLAKQIATLDVLSAGRAMCGLGVGWFAQEYDAAGIDFPTVGRRYAHLEDALQVLPLLWGKGSPRFEGTTVTIDETLCYPRPIQPHVPIVVGGSGERRTLATGSALRRRLQPVRRARGRRPQGRRAGAALQGDRP